MGLIMVALVAFGGGLGLFHALVASITRTCIRSSPDLYLVSPVLDLLIVFVCLIFAWGIGYFQKGTFAFREIGTKFYGRAYTEDGYIIATKWLTAIIPLLPIRSYVIHYQVKGVSKFDFETQRNEMLPFKGYFYFPQMLRTAIISYGMILWCLGCLWLMFMAPCF